MAKGTVSSRSYAFKFHLSSATSYLNRTACSSQCGPGTQRMGPLDRGFTEVIAAQLFLAGGHPVQTAGRTVTVHTTHCLQRKRLLAMACGIAPGPRLPAVGHAPVQLLVHPAAGAGEDLRDTGPGAATGSSQQEAVLAQTAPTGSPAPRQMWLGH